MFRGGAVACLATHIDLMPRGVVTRGRRVVIFFHVRRVTLGAHEIPGWRRPRPVQRIAMINTLIGIEMKPASPGHVPGDRESLQAASSELDQVLLQRFDTKGVLHFEVGGTTVLAIGAHPERAVALE